MFRKSLSIAVAAAFMSLAATASRAEPLKIGLLKCHVAAGAGLVLFGKRELNCHFHPDDGRPEHYVGSIDRFGLDIGETGPGVLAWLVFAPTVGPNHGALAGAYVGGGATATVGIGVGANALIGGLERSIALQPVSFQAQTGLNVNAGLTALTLRSTR
jgi:hypothetical protein